MFDVVQFRNELQEAAMEKKRRKVRRIFFWLAAAAGLAGWLLFIAGMTGLL